MYIYIYIYVYTHLSLSLYIYIYIHTHKHTYTYTTGCTRRALEACINYLFEGLLKMIAYLVYIKSYICLDQHSIFNKLCCTKHKGELRQHVYIYIYLYMYIHIYVCVYVYIYIYI